MRRNRRAGSNMDDIYHTLAAGSIKALDVHLHNGGTIHVTSSAGEGLLAAAIQRRDFGLFDRCIQKGAKVQQFDYLGRTPLHLAVELDIPDFVEVLLRQGACIDHVDKNGDTPLFKAIRQENLHMTKFLLSENADVNFVNSHAGLTPLTAAIEMEDFEMICLILAHCPHLSFGKISKISQEEVPLVRAMKKNDVGIFSKILECNENKHVRETFSHELIWALEHSEIRMPAVIKLLKHGVHLNLCEMHRVLGTVLKRADPQLAVLLIQNFPQATSANIQENLLLRCLLGDCCKTPSRACVKLKKHTPMHCRMTAALLHCGLSIHTFCEASRDGRFDTCECRHWIKPRSASCGCTARNLQSIHLQPAALKVACRTSIRRVLGSALSSKVNMLGLPRILEDYLQFGLDRLQDILNLQVPEHNLHINVTLSS